MKHLFALLSASLVMMSGADLRVQAHEQFTRDYSDTIKSAKAVAVAEVVSERRDESRCSTNYRFELKPLYAIKGSVDTTRLYTFSYTIHEWKKATFPWQEDCPSVNYRLPPIAGRMGRGSKVIITIEYFEPWKTDAVFSTRDFEYLGEVKKLLGK